jgi:hypothetical protein
MMKSLKKLFSAGPRPDISRRGKASRSKFERYEFSSVRFECVLSAMSHSGACEGLFLDTYSTEVIREIMIRIGLIEHLRDIGFTKPVMEIEKSNGGIHILKMYYGRPAPEHLLIEIRLSRIIYMPEELHVRGIIKDRRFNVIAIEWLCFQNPKLTFTSERPRLPGQTFPGLGGVQYITPLMEMFAGDLGVEAILDVPERFHAAVMYSHRFKFMDPEREGMMRAVLRDLGSHPLADLSWGFNTGTICDARTGEPVAYVPAEQILPISENLAQYFTSHEYRKRVDKAMSSKRYALDYDRMAQERKNNPEYKYYT